MIKCLMFLISTVFWIIELAADCPYKECDCSGDTISCEVRGFTEIPRLISTSTAGLTNLILAINWITSIPAGRLPANLVSVSFASNPITNIDDSAFDESATTLKSLYFSKASFLRIPDAFLHIHTLTSLSISETTIQNWNDDVMKHIGLTLTTLYLDDVDLQTWPGWLKNFSHLTELSVSDSSVSAIPDGALDMMTISLTSLNLDTNRLTAIPKALSTLTSLQILSMQENAISDTAWLPSASNLSSLTLTNNKISDAKQLSTALQPYTDSLTDLSLGNNLLAQIPELYFLAQLGSLDISYNKISDRYSGSIRPALNGIDLGYNLLPSIPIVMSTLQSVTDLDLPYNAILELSGVDYPPLTTDVDFEHNLITAINAASFPEHSFIVTIKLNNNPITQISTDAFKNLNELRELYLGNTRLSRLPLALAPITSLRVVDLTDNVYLVCTCIERNLAPWAHPFYSGDLRGDCGLTSVYDFLVTLSLDCPPELHITVE